MNMVLILTMLDFFLILIRRREKELVPDVKKFIEVEVIYYSYIYMSTHIWV